uniref:Uncharacterized protein n=1 Tax=Strigops habroptila TaxID=2489341 RepID=A0A672V2A3_STRHB
MCVCTCIYVCVCIYLCMCVYRCVCMSIYVCVHMCVYMCMYMCIYMCVWVIPAPRRSLAFSAWAEGRALNPAPHIPLLPECSLSPLLGKGLVWSLWSLVPGLRPSTDGETESEGA